MPAKVKNFRKSSIDPRCKNICKGKCWNPKDNAATQRAAAELFKDDPNGKPNGCVRSSKECLNSVKCPAALGLLD